MRILYIITKAEWAGAQRVVYELIDSLSKTDGFETVLFVGDEGILESRIKEMGVRVRVCKHLKWKPNLIEDFLGIVELLKMIREENPDVVHCHSTKAGFLGRLAARLAGVPRIIYTVHGWWPVLRFNNPITRNLIIWLERTLGKISTDIVYLTKADLEMAKKWGIGDGKRIHQIQNGIKIREKIRPCLRRELNAGMDELIVGNVARVCKQKNPENFLHIASEMVRSRKDVRFVWIGEGPDLDDIRKRIQAEGIERCHFIGFRENVLDYMSEFNLMLLTSDVEGMPISLLEARSLGVAILAKEAEGLKEHLDDCCMEKELTPETVGTHLKMKCRLDDEKEEKNGYEYFIKKHIRMYSSDISRQQVSNR